MGSTAGKREQIKNKERKVDHMRCSRCGTENVSQCTQCVRCGNPMNQGIHMYEDKNQKNGNSTILILTGILSFVIVLCLAGIIGFWFLSDGSGKDPESEIQEKNISEEQEETSDRDNTMQSLTDLKNEYENRFYKYSIDRPYQVRIDDVNRLADQAIANEDAEQYASLETKYNNLEAEILEDNKRQVEDYRYEIIRIDTSKASATENETLTAHNDRVSTYLKDGNYKQAILELDNYRNYANAVKAEADARQIKENQDSQKSQQNPTTIVVTPSSDYILADSSSRYLSGGDVSHLSRNEATLAKNEIFARYGRKFRDQSIQEYFNSKTWYCGIYEPDDVMFSHLSDIEQANVKLLEKYE